MSLGRASISYRILIVRCRVNCLLLVSILPSISAVSVSSWLGALGSKIGLRISRLRCQDSTRERFGRLIVDGGVGGAGLIPYLKI
jgi:hypothetical protein